jgi:hypothetical protein
MAQDIAGTDGYVTSRRERKKVEMLSNPVKNRLLQQNPPKTDLRSTTLGLLHPNPSGHSLCLRA